MGGAPDLTVYQQGIAQVDAPGLNTFMQTCNVNADLRAFVGVEGMECTTRGNDTINDGGAGNWMWVPTGTGPDDNLNFIVPPGLVEGCWVRVDFNVPSSGTVTSITAGTGLTATPSNPITRAGTISLDPYTGTFTGAQPETYTAVLSRSVWLDDLVPTGTASDYGAYITALQSALPRGGTCFLTPGKNYPVLTNCTVPIAVTIKGPYTGIGTTSPNSEAVNFSNYGAIQLASTATITLKASAGLIGCLVYRSGMTFPVTTPSGFAGTAFTWGGDQAYLEDCMVCGFAQAMTSTGFSRGRVIKNSFDNTANIYIYGSEDTWLIDWNHDWPFTTDSTGSDIRSGANFIISNSSDNTLVTNNFCYGYATGFSSIDSNGVTFIGDVTNNPNVAGSVGFSITGSTAASGNNLTSCQSFGDDTGLYILTTAAQGQVAKVLNFLAGSNVTNGILIDTGNVGAVSVLGGNINNTVNALTLKSGSCQVTIDAVHLDTISGTYPFNVTVSTQEFFIGANISGVGIGDGTSLAGTNAFLLSKTATGSGGITLSLPVTGNVFFINTGGSVTNILGGWAGREVTLIFGGTTTINSTALGSATLTTVYLPGGNFTSAAGKTLRLIHPGNNSWVQG